MLKNCRKRRRGSWMMDQPHNLALLTVQRHLRQEVGSVWADRWPPRHRKVRLLWLCVKRHYSHTHPDSTYKDKYEFIRNCKWLEMDRGGKCERGSKMSKQRTILRDVKHNRRFHFSHWPAYKQKAKPKITTPIRQAPGPATQLQTSLWFRHCSNKKIWAWQSWDSVTENQ